MQRLEYSLTILSASIGHSQAPLVPPPIDADQGEWVLHSVTQLGSNSMETPSHSTINEYINGVMTPVSRELHRNMSVTSAVLAIVWMRERKLHPIEGTF